MSVSEGRNTRRQLACRNALPLIFTFPHQPPINRIFSTFSLNSSEKSTKSSILITLWFSKSKIVYRRLLIDGISINTPGFFFSLKSHLLTSNKYAGRWLSLTSTALQETLYKLTSLVC